ncbi:MAG: hypothetical protein LBN35_00230 [Clostridiales Family XIII bacterium]|nr:hypothetical protein [Clostridiales Family XIII bacterium]
MSFIDRPKYTCALGGAIATIAALPDTVPIVHASPGCGLNLGYAADAGGGYAGYGYCGGGALPSSNVIESQVVFGGEDRLTEQIERTVEVVDGQLYFVITGCMVEMIGDDIYGSVSRADVGDAEVIFAETGGFRGNSYKGYDIALSALFRGFVSKGLKKDAKTVNVFGLPPSHDVFLEGNLSNIKELLAKLGVKANTIFGETDTLDDLRRSSEASLNIVLSDRFGIDSAAVFEQVHETPYITTGLPVGAHQTALFLRQVARALSLDKDAVEKLIADETSLYFKRFVHFANLYNDYDTQRYVIIVGDSNIAPAVAKFAADDLGFLPEIAIINDIITDDEKQKVIDRFEQGREGIIPEIVFTPHVSEILPAIKRHWQLDRNQPYYDSMTPAVIIGSTFEVDLAQDLGLPLLPAAYPVTNRVVVKRGYAGFEGGIALAEDLLTTIISNR